MLHSVQELHVAWNRAMMIIEIAMHAGRLLFIAQRNFLLFSIIRDFRSDLCRLQHPHHVAASESIRVMWSWRHVGDPWIFNVTTINKLAFHAHFKVGTTSGRNKITTPTPRPCRLHPRSQLTCPPIFYLIILPTAYTVRRYSYRVLIVQMRRVVANWIGSCRHFLASRDYSYRCIYTDG